MIKINKDQKLKGGAETARVIYGGDELLVDKSPYSRNSKFSKSPSKTYTKGSLGQVSRTQTVMGMRKT
jgi:hypothetical protein